MSSGSGSLHELVVDVEVLQVRDVVLVLDDDAGAGAERHPEVAVERRAAAEGVQLGLLRRDRERQRVVGARERVHQAEEVAERRDDARGLLVVPVHLEHDLAVVVGVDDLPADAEGVVDLEHRHARPRRGRSGRGRAGCGSDCVIQMCVMKPGPSMSASVRSSPGMTIQLSRLRPVWSKLDARAVRARRARVRSPSMPLGVRGIGHRRPSSTRIATWHVRTSIETFVCRSRLPSRPRRRASSAVTSPISRAIARIEAVLRYICAKPTPMSGRRAEAAMATMVDVAKMAEVSISTVSHVLNGTRNVEPGDAAAGARRDRADRLPAGRPRPGHAAVPHRQHRPRRLGRRRARVRRDGARRRERGRRARAHAAAGELRRGRRPRGARGRTLLDRRVDGLILARAAGIRARRSCSRSRDEKTPVVLLDRLYADLPFDQVGADNRDSMRRLTEHLVAAGHRRFVVVSGDTRVPTLQERLDGFRDALWAAQVPVRGSRSSSTTSIARWHAPQLASALESGEHHVRDRVQHAARRDGARRHCDHRGRPDDSARRRVRHLRRLRRTPTCSSRASPPCASPRSTWASPRCGCSSSG